jgi:hypothetical protein
VTDAITHDQVLRYLVDVDYPAGKEVLVAAAERAAHPKRSSAASGPSRRSSTAAVRR